MNTKGIKQPRAGAGCIFHSGIILAALVLVLPIVASGGNQKSQKTRAPHPALENAKPSEIHPHGKLALDALLPGEWYEFPNSTLKSVDPCPAGNCVWSGVTKQASVIAAYSGGCYDTQRDRLIVWGGGHRNYYGNEVYAFSLTEGKWTRLTEPSTNIILGEDGVVGIAYYGDGLPSSRHTYSKIDYDPVSDKMFSLVSYKGATDSFDLATNTWQRWPAFPYAEWYDHHGAAVYNPNDGSFYAKASDSRSPLYKFDPHVGGGTWTRLPVQWHTNPDVVLAIDTKRNRLVGIGGTPKVQDQTMFWIDLNNPTKVNYIGQTGDAGGLALKSRAAPGFVYDPVNDRFLGWAGGAGVYQLHPETWEWRKLRNTNSVIPPASPSTYGRFRYVPSKQGVVGVTATDKNVFFFKLTTETMPIVAPLPPVLNNDK